MKWQALRTKHAIVGGCLEIREEDIVGTAQGRVYRGVIEKIDWHGIPKFHLIRLVQFDPRTASWKPARRCASVQPDFPEGSDASRNYWITDPLEFSPGVISFASNSSQAFHIFPPDTQPPRLPFGLDKVSHEAEVSASAALH